MSPGRAKSDEEKRSSLNKVDGQSSGLGSERTPMGSHVLQPSGDARRVGKPGRRAGPVVQLFSERKRRSETSPRDFPGASSACQRSLLPPRPS